MHDKACESPKSGIKNTEDSKFYRFGFHSNHGKYNKNNHNNMRPYLTSSMMRIPGSSPT